MSLCFARCEFDCGVTLTHANYWIISVDSSTNPSQSLFNHFEDAEPLFRHMVPHSPVHARSRANFIKRASQRPKFCTEARDSVLKPAHTIGCCRSSPEASSQSLPWFSYIHTGIFQGKIKNFPGLETPPVRSSDPTVQYSVGPMVRSYTRQVPILRTFFITEFRGSRSSGLTCKKNVKNFPGENFPGQNFPGQNFPGENFPGEKLSRGNFPGKTGNALT